MHPPAPARLVLALAALLAAACSDCPNDDARVEDGRCVCTDGSGNARTVDGAECGLDDGPTDAAAVDGAVDGAVGDGGCDGGDCVDGGCPGAELPETAGCPDRREVTRVPEDPGATPAAAYDLGVLSPDAPRALCASVNGCADPVDWLRFTLEEHAQVSMTLTDVVPASPASEGLITVRVAVDADGDGSVRDGEILWTDVFGEASSRLVPLPKATPLFVALSLDAPRRLSAVLNVAATPPAMASLDEDPPAAGCDVPALVLGQAVTDYVGATDAADVYTLTLDEPTDVAFEVPELFGSDVTLALHLDAAPGRVPNCVLDAGEELVEGLSGRYGAGDASDPVRLAAGIHRLSVRAAEGGAIYTLAPR